MDAFAVARQFSNSPRNSILQRFSDLGLAAKACVFVWTPVKGKHTNYHLYILWQENVLVLVNEKQKKLESCCDVGHKYVPEAGGQNELQRDPFKQVQTRVRPAREKGELLF